VKNLSKLFLEPFSCYTALMSFLDIIFVLIGLAVGVGVGAFVLKPGAYNEESRKRRAKELLQETEKEAATILESAKQHVVELAEQFKSEEAEFGAQVETMEKVVALKEASAERWGERLSGLKATSQKHEDELKSLREEARELSQKMTAELMNKAAFTLERAHEELIQKYEQEFSHEAELRLQRYVEWVEEVALREARNALTEVICRYSAPASREPNMTKLEVSQDAVKGRIVGRGGRMISFFEELFGVDVIFNDEPNTIIISCFNLVQEQTAKLAMQRLMRERIITENVILEMKARADADMEKVLRKEGARVLEMIGLKNLPEELVRLVGRLNFRTSYGQNVMRHSLEVGYFSRMLAAMIGADEKVAFYGGFFHDIGKAIDQEVGGSHDALTKEILEKYEFSWEVTHAAWTHHNAIPPETVEAKIVQAADAISAGRPGARAESLERYVERMKELQGMALSFEGVRKAFAINAGREVRAIVDSDRVDDKKVVDIAVDIAKMVEAKGGYPGKIKIITIRSTRTATTTKGRGGPQLQP